MPNKHKRLGRTGYKLGRARIEQHINKHVAERREEHHKIHPNDRKKKGGGKTIEWIPN